MPKRANRTFLPDNLVISSWQDIKSYFHDLDDREVKTSDDMWDWLKDLSELEAVIEEDQAWRYIKMNINTRDKEASASFHRFIEKIEPEIAPFQNKYDLKLIGLDFPEFKEGGVLSLVSKKAEFHIRVFKEENIKLHAQLQAKEQEFGSIASEMDITWDGEKMTLPKASVILKDTDRNKRAEVYHLIQDRRLQDKDKFDRLFNELVALRHKIAVNAEFENFRDYKFVEMCRFSYTKKDCFDFHEAIQKEAVPIIEHIDAKRKEQLELSELRPWDAQVDVTGKPALKPFVDSDELIRKTINCFNEIDPYFGSCIQIMSEMAYLDLDSRPGKAPGGFNYPLYEIGVPFIYMNSAGTLRDLVTMVHEGGHAIHSFLSRDLKLTVFKDLTSEIAELASMSMELNSMEHWHHFFENEEDLKRAKCEQLEQVIETLPWVAQIDKFQHWIYENPEHTVKQREDCWEDLMGQFGSSVVDWTGLEIERKNLWQKQLHLFEVPFYYIEYGMAQLGAIAMWRNYKTNPTTAIEKYKKALSLGYTKSISETFSEAGIEFNFTREYVKDLMDFVRDELDSLQN